MDCKIIQQWLDDDIDQRLSDENKKILNTHLETCPDCSNYKHHLLSVHNALKSLYEPADISFPVDSVMKQITPKKKFKPQPFVAAVLVLFLCFQFNTELFAFVDKLPIFGDLLDYFSTDKSIQYAEDHGYTVYDILTEQDNRKLYIKDLYMDNTHSTFKMAVETDDGYLRNFSWKITGETESKIGGSSFSALGESEYINQDPWKDIKTFPMQGVEINEFSIQVEIYSDDDTYYFDNVVINIEDLTAYEPTIIPINKSIDGDFGSLEFVSLEIHPSNMYLVTNEKLNSDVVNINLSDLILTDNNKQEYRFTNHLYSDETHTRYQIEPSFYFDEDVSSLDLEIYGIKYDKAIKTMPMIIGDSFEFVSRDAKIIIPKGGYLSYSESKYNQKSDDYNITDQYVIESITEVVGNEVLDDHFTLTLTGEISKDESDFPRLAVYYNNQWHYGNVDTTNQGFVDPPKEEQLVHIPFIKLNDWFNVQIKTIDFIENEFTVTEFLTTVMPEDYDYQNDIVLSRIDVESLFTKYNMSINKNELDILFGVLPGQKYSLTVGELENLLGYSLNELTNNSSNNDDLELKAITSLQKYIYKNYNDPITNRQAANMISGLQNDISYVYGNYTHQRYLSLTYIFYRVPLEPNTEIKIMESNFLETHPIVIEVQ